MPTIASAGEPKANLWVQLKLEALGFPGVSSSFLDVGYSMLTVHFLDSSHLLVTYSLRKLVPRIKDDPETHDDRLVAGEVVEVPSGKVVAKTEWHMHDHGRYLWTLGRGRFLIRIGERLYTMAPLAGLGTAQPFERTLFPSQRQPRLVDVSEDGGVVTLETVVVQSDPNGARTIMLGDEGTAGEPTATKTLIDFYRVAGDGGKEGPVTATRAGHVVSQAPMRLPVDADGLLWASQSGNGQWAINFDGFGGKTISLGKIDSSCQPRLQMLSRSEFLAVTCRGAEDRLKMGSYGFDGKETWEESIGDFGQPVFAFAPAAGRFGVSHIVEPATVPSTMPVNGPPEMPRQEVRIYQNASGDQLLHVDCSPIIKTGENFDVSADGLLAAVIRNGAIAVYRLPKPGKRDIEDMAEVDRFAPPVSTEAITLPRLTTAPGGARTPVAAVAEAEEAAPAAASEAGLVVAPAPAAAPRRPPSLLKPGEKPEFGTTNEQPKP